MITLTYWDLLASSLLVLILAAVSAYAKLGITRTLLIAAIRCAVQLGLIGLILNWLFGTESLAVLLLVVTVMWVAAGREVVGRQSRRLKGLYAFASGAVAMFLSSFTVTIVALTLIIDVQPWYQPQYAIPLLGMMLGNTMTGVSLATERLTTSVWERAAQIEQRLMLGQTAREAMRPLMRESATAGIMPIVNAMSAAGLVSLPGMMTGQILAGTPPTEAVKYQLMIMFLVSAGTGLGVVGSLWVTQMRLFDSRQRLRLDRLSSS
ncbi:MAG: putative ABC transport system permease protein [Gammaproteobacteria bacterium]|jgi:putative ABC transport system permease protein